MKRETILLHFVGIGGIGMSGLSELFFHEGYRVSGSDLAESDTTRRLSSLGISVKIGHQASNVHGATVVVISSAVKDSNPEVAEARRLGIPVIPRAEALGELMRGKIGVAVAGTHGKTTTTSLLGTVFSEAGWDPTLVIGGKVDALGGNAKRGLGQYVLAEADESDGSFLHLPATYALITNIDEDHMDHYGSLDRLDQAFCDLVAKLPFYGRAIVCVDDPGVARCLSRFSKPTLTYGFNVDADYSIISSAPSVHGSRFSLRNIGDFEINLFGKHNVLNATAAIALAHVLGMPIADLQRGVLAFRGVRRRMELRWKSKDDRFQLIEDYGHHPTEIRATLSAVRQFWRGPIKVIFQPHRYSRTERCWQGFVDALGSSDVLKGDEVILLDVYAAGETEIEGITSSRLAQAVQKSRPDLVVRHVSDWNKEYEQHLELQDSSTALVLCLGAGSITHFASDLASRLAKKTGYPKA